jgi:hypothetical protein
MTIFEGILSCGELQPEGRLTIVSVAPIFLARSRIPSNPQLAILSIGRERLVTNAHSVILSNQ